MITHSEELPKVDVTDVSVTALPLNEQVTLIVGWAKEGLSKIVCVANVHMLMESRRNIRLRSALDSAHLVTPDGMPLVWIMRLIGVSSQDRVAGMDIFKQACQQCEEENISIYLFGSTQAVLKKMVSRLNEDYPRLKVAGTESPPFRSLSQREQAQTIERINNSGAGLTFVALGCPKQEYWMARHHNKVNAVMVGVGAVFPVYARVKKHAPEWIRNNGLEWLYRLAQEPRRLFGRYATTIPPFLYFALKQLKTERILKWKGRLTSHPLENDCRQLFKSTLFPFVKSSRKSGEESQPVR